MNSGAETAVAIELQGINKSFGAVHANKDVDLKVHAGTIHGIIGENGAGKSTLMSILYGFYTADGGTISVGGQPIKINNSDEAIAAGIGMVHQHFMLVDPFTVLENVMLGAESGALLAKSRVAARKELQRLETDYGLFVDPDAIVGDLPVGQQQRVEILKALYRGAEILILDEPTGVLTPQETDQLFEILKALRAEGVTIILITHKLREIMAITDAVSVMRGGEMVAHRETVNTDREELAELMVGRKVVLEMDKRAAQSGENRIEVRGLNLFDDRGVARLSDVNFEVKSGEVVGIAGVSGNGQSELLDVLSGIAAPSSGDVQISGMHVSKAQPGDAADRRDHSIAHVPEDRLRLGLIPRFLAEESAILGYHDRERYRKGVLIDAAAMREDCEAMMQGFDVRPPDPVLPSSKFSGGNQQKLILAREIMKEPDVLLVGQPTRGVDIGAIEFIHKQIIAMRDAGAAVLLVSVELDEILSLSDRIIVMCEGRIVGEVAREGVDIAAIGLMMTGVSPEEASRQVKGDVA